MPPTPRSPPSVDDDETPDEDDLVEEGTARPGPKKSKGRTTGRPGVKAWDATDSDDDGTAPEKDEETADAEEEESPDRHVYFRARDSVWFEPLVAVMIIVVLLVGLYAYTSNWPPVYVVESESMQHGYNDQLGLINTGDLVLARQEPVGSIVPYVVGIQTGYTTYGEYGDVVLYHANGDTTGAPIIHRAIMWMDYNANGTYSVPELNGLACGNSGPIFFSANSSGAHRGCSTIGLRGTLTLFGIGWQGVPVPIPLDPTILGRSSGLVTMGDNNIQSGVGGITDQYGGISSLVQPGWIIGVARGMIPWFGALKLALGGNDTEVPPQSWQYMGLTLVGLFLGALGLHLFLRSEGYEDARRKRQEAAEAAAAGAAPPTKRRSRWRIWERDAGDEEPEDAPPKSKRRPPPKSSAPASAVGRPRPRIGRRPPPKPVEPEDADPSDGEPAEL